MIGPLFYRYPQNLLGEERAEPMMDRTWKADMKEDPKVEQATAVPTKLILIDAANL